MDRVRVTQQECHKLTVTRRVFYVTGVVTNLERVARLVSEWEECVTW